MKSRASASEKTTWAWWVHLLFIGLFWGIPLFVLLPEALGRGSEDMSPLAAAAVFVSLILLPPLIYTFLGSLRIDITDEGVQAVWGFSGIIKKFFPYEEILKAEAVTYSPLGEFGGWGLRAGLGKKKAWTTRGNRALVLHLADVSRFYLTSMHPERLLVRIQSAGAGKMAAARETSGDEGGS
jgi:hypothetical protein